MLYFTYTLYLLEILNLYTEFNKNEGLKSIRANMLYFTYILYLLEILIF